MWFKFIFILVKNGKDVPVLFSALSNTKGNPVILNRWSSVEKTCFDRVIRVARDKILHLDNRGDGPGDELGSHATVSVETGN